MFSKVVVASVLCASVLAGAAVAQPSRESHTIPLRGTFHVVWSAASCPKGTPKLTPSGSGVPCYLNVGHGSVPGLGSATERYTLVVLNADTKCAKWSFKVVLTVAGKGAIDANALNKGCFSPGQTEGTVHFTVTGGTGAYAGASGSGTIHSGNANETGSGRGTATDTWVGTLSL